MSERQPITVGLVRNVEKAADRRFCGRIRDLPDGGGVGHAPYCKGLGPFFRETTGFS